MAMVSLPPLVEHPANQGADTVRNKVLICHAGIIGCNRREAYSERRNVGGAFRGFALRFSAASFAASCGPYLGLGGAKGHSNLSKSGGC